jgi:MFS family permease
MGSSALNNVPASFREVRYTVQGNTLKADRLPAQMSSKRNYGRYFAVYCLSAFGGPGLGGFIGAFVDANIGWRWNLRVQGILVGVSTIFCIIVVPEMSLKAIINKSETSEVGMKATINYREALSGLPRTCVKLICEPFSWLTGAYGMSN